MGNACLQAAGATRLFGVARDAMPNGTRNQQLDYVALREEMSRLGEAVTAKRAKARDYLLRARKLRKEKAAEEDVERNYKMCTLLNSQASESESQLITLDSLFETLEHAKLTRHSMVAMRGQLDYLRQSTETFKTLDAEKLMDELVDALEMTRETIGVVSTDASTKPVRLREMEKLLVDDSDSASSFEEQLPTRGSAMHTVKLEREFAL
jgi:hypothetical protein